MLFYYAYNHAKKHAIRLNAIVKPKASAEMPVKGSSKPQKSGKAEGNKAQKRELKPKRGKNKAGNNANDLPSSSKKTPEHE